MFYVFTSQQAYEVTMLSVCLSAWQLLNQFISFNESFYERYVSGCHPNANQ
jgi:hypothetical protein